MWAKRSFFCWSRLDHVRRGTNAFLRSRVLRNGETKVQKRAKVEEEWIWTYYKKNRVKETFVAESEDCVYLNEIHPSLISKFIIVLIE